MRRMILPLMLFVSAACRPQAGPLSDEDVASIKNAVQSFQEAALAGDFSAAVESYTEDAILMPLPPTEAEHMEGEDHT